MKVMREMKARFVKDYVLFIEGASFFFLCNASDWQSSSSLRRTGGVINLDWEEKRRRGNRGERVQKVLWGRKTSKSAFFIRLVYCKTGINLENIHAYIHTHTHTCNLRMHINIANFICMNTGESSPPRRLGGYQEKCTSRWEEMEKLPTDDP